MLRLVAKSNIMEIALSCDGLVKTYGSGTKAVHALQGVSLSVSGGEIFSLLGPNGAGKTTLIKCVLGIVFTSAGSGSVLGSPFGSVSAKEHIGYLPENHRYPAHLTGGQVLRYFGKLSGLEAAKLESQITRTLELTGMSDWRDTKVKKYSKGMMQRLGLAQALINEPQLIMLDEPTDGVDPVGRKEIREVLVRLKNEGKTIFLNSHLLSEVERISDRVVIMDHGKIVEQGTVEALTRTGNIYQLKLGNVTPEVLSALHVALLPTADGSLEMSFLTVEELNAAIDYLRGQSVLIESIVPKKSTLEDRFVDLFKSGDITHQ